MSAYQTVLTQIVAERHLQPEPVATAALVHLLRRSSAASDGVARMCADILPGLPSSGLDWSGQVSAVEDVALPDLIATDTTGSRIVLEAKFDAELTASQLDTTYLNRLPVGQPGLLVFLAPANRLPALWPALLRGPGQQPAVESLAPAESAYFIDVLGGGRALAAVSWEHLLHRLTTAVVDSGDKAAQSDLSQLDDLVRWRTGTQWVPLMPGDLPGRVGLQLAVVTRAAIAAISSLGLKFTNGTSDDGAGRWIVVPDGPRVWAGVWPVQWGRSSLSPTWATIFPQGVWTTTNLQERLRTLADPGGPGLLPYQNGWAVPLLPPYGVEEPRVVIAFQQQLAQLLHMLRPTK